MNNSLTDSKFWDSQYNVSSKSMPNPITCRYDYELIQQIKPFLKDRGFLIEMGCGDSYWLPYFAKLGYSVCGIDYSTDRLLSTSNKLGIGGFRYWRLIHSDVTEFVSKYKGQFDVVFSAGLIEHFSSQSDILSIFKQYLK